jgi:tRNA(Ile)-lysidine synthase
MDLLFRVRRFVRQHDLMRPGARVVCALSGGSDSVALAHILAELDAAGESTFAGCAHMNHQLRSTAPRDEQFSRDVADRLGRPIFVEREDVAARARRQKQSLENAAHAARYEFYARARAHLGADAVALGHTRDDQAETFLLRLLRGAGPRGLAGMYPRHEDVVRPLLDCTRAELREYLAARARPEFVVPRQAQDDPESRRGVEGFVDDETNLDLTIPRNRVRETLLPLLAAEFNPNIVEVLAREADLARELWAWLESEAASFGADLNVETVRRAPTPLRRLVLWRAMTAAAGGRPVTFDHVGKALTLLDAQDGASIDAPGHRVQRKGPRLVLTKRGSKGSRGSRGSKGSGAAKGSDASNRLNPLNHLNPLNLFWYSLSIPGEVVDPRHGFTVSVEPSRDIENSDRAILGSGATAAVRRDLIGGALAVRNRRPGDRFRPIGLGGRKKLQDYFVDRKIARDARDFIPIVVDDRDRIVWVAGYGIDESFRVTDRSQPMLILKLRYFSPTGQKSRGGDPMERCS